LLGVSKVVVITHAQKEMTAGLTSLVPAATCCPSWTHLMIIIEVGMLEQETTETFAFLIFICAKMLHGLIVN